MIRSWTSLRNFERAFQRVGLVGPPCKKSSDQYQRLRWDWNSIRLGHDCWKFVSWRFRPHLLLSWQYLFVLSNGVNYWCFTAAPILGRLQKQITDIKSIINALATIFCTSLSDLSQGKISCSGKNSRNVIAWAESPARVILLLSLFQGCVFQILRLSRGIFVSSGIAAIAVLYGSTQSESR